LWIIAVATACMLIYIFAFIFYLILYPLGNQVRSNITFVRDLAFVGFVYGFLIIYAVIEFNKTQIILWIVLCLIVTIGLLVCGFYEI